MLRFRPLVITLALLACAVAAHAQSVVNPRTVSFIPSPDHDAKTTNGDAIVSGYELWFYERGASDPFLFLDLDKPAPASNGLISVDFSTLLAAAPRAGRVLEARVVAVGPGGFGVSDASNPFMFGRCVSAVAPQVVSFAAEGGAATVAVAADASCTWDVSGASWVCVTSGAAGRGSGAVTITASPNSTTAPRQGTVVIGGLNVQVIQQAGWLPPMVFVRTPADRASFSAPAQIDVSTAFGLPMSDRRGSRRGTQVTPAVIEVRFYANGILIGTVTTPPYTMRWRDVPAGTYQLAAMATNNLGARTISRTVTVTVK